MASTLTSCAFAWISALSAVQRCISLAIAARRSATADANCVVGVTSAPCSVVINGPIDPATLLSVSGPPARRRVRRDPPAAPSSAVNCCANGAAPACARIPRNLRERFLRRDHIVIERLRQRELLLQPGARRLHARVHLQRQRLRVASCRRP